MTFANKCKASGIKEPFGARKNASPSWPGDVIVDILNEK
jgi:hypothetical protein